ncbi:MAG: 16S rRNA (cytidine(1402)-2'-O)-methyltransferase [Gammaproteobacteria bacterium]|nr:16S rRNA (cytidine(1402)-2'-O)-methyltransferase [Chromatiales bacterium]MDP6673278.1 16S rRNA (cytidine(1402)-2'-O)-methyltransferase [Gammaproteobacteria bacterium]
MTTDPGTLYVVATPIGNLDDISARARDVLQKAVVVAAEDTRRAGQLLTHLGLKNRLLSLHEHNEKSRVDEVLTMLLSGDDVALISDAGTPLISDPGYRVVERVRAEALPVSPIPGCCAAIAALSVSGLPTDRFRFEGFLPARPVARRNRLKALSDVTETLILYESVHRVAELLADLEAILGAQRPITLARELTKRYETIYRGTVTEVREQLEADPGGGKGEFTLVIAGVSEQQSATTHELERIVTILLQSVSASQAASLAAEITGVKKREAYRLATELKERD